MFFIKLDFCSNDVVVVLPAVMGDGDVLDPLQVAGARGTISEQPVLGQTEKLILG